MKYIKKVSVAQLESNTGTIIDSMTSGDDHHTNAPSIDAVDNFVEDTLTPVNYTITPVYSAVTPVYTLKKIGHLVVLDFNTIYLASVSANAWTNIATVANDCIPSTALATACTVMNSDNGNIVGYGRMEIQTNGNIRVKSNIAQTGVGFTASVSWTV